MTIKEALSVIKEAKEIRISGFGGNVSKFDHTDPLMVDALGNYVVESIYACNEEVFEIGVRMIPAKQN